MTIDFVGRTVVVTGAGNGLGRAHALELGANLRQLRALYAVC
jgi:NAD(P)-dependent dehydrogenase (short-subunit alcohol dehydrogenase family)